MAGPVDAPLDVLVVTAVPDEWDAILAVDTGATAGGSWALGPDGTAKREFTSGGGALRIGVIQSYGMGGTHAAIAAAPLLERHPEIRCLAMCGVCAGRRGDVALGDVIIADRAWHYDAGKRKVTVDGGGGTHERFQGDIDVYRIRPPGWKQRAERFRIDPDAPWIKERPLSYEEQGDWILDRLNSDDEPLQHADRGSHCPDWGVVLRQLWKVGRLKDGTLTLTEAGRAHIARRRLMEPDGLQSSPFKVVVGPMASGAPVVEDPTVFDRLSEGMRKVIGLEMESASILTLAELGGVPHAIVMKGVMDHADAFKSDNMKAFAAKASAECLIAFLREHLPSGDTLGVAEEAARSAAASILRSQKARHRFHSHPLVRLEMQESTNGTSVERPLLTLEHLVEWVAAGQSVVLHGRPGAGKSMTLLQLAELLQQRVDGPVPIVIGVASWTSSGRDLAEYVSDHLAAMGVNSIAVGRLLATSRIALLLNGWNEAALSSQSYASDRLQDFVLRYPSASLVVASRGKEVAGVPGARAVELQDLTDDLRRAMAENAVMGDLERFLFKVQSDATLRATTKTPLFYAAALELAKSGRPIPTTRAELLGGFLDEAEAKDNHAAMLAEAPCHGFHREYLEAVACSMTRQGRTTASREELHEALAECSRDLIQDARLAAPAAATAIAESLVRHHVLVPTPDDETTYAFLHEQFQEWFAACSLRTRVRRLITNRGADDIYSFQRDTLNHLSWRLPIEFLLELLVASADTSSAAQVVRWMMQVDLIFAAELADIAGPRVWPAIGEELGAALRAWYAAGARTHQRAAVAGMLASGRSDFSDVVLGELGLEPDDQSWYGLTRLCERYRSVRAASLGDGWQVRVAAWPDRLQEAFFLEVYAGDEELDFAVMRAIDGLPLTRLAAFSLLSSEADVSRIRKVLSATGVAEWPPRFYSRDLARLPPEAVTGLADKLRSALVASDDLPSRFAIIKALVDVGDSSSWIGAAKSDVDVALAMRRAARVRTSALDALIEPDQSAGILVSYLVLLRTADAGWVDEWIMSRLGDDLMWRKPFASLLTALPDTALVALARRVLPGANKTLTPAQRCAETRDRVQALTARPSTMVVVAIVQVYVAMRPSSEEEQALGAALRDLAVGALVDGVVHAAERLASPGDIYRVVSLVLPGSMPAPDYRQTLSTAQANALRSLALALDREGDEESLSLRPQLAVLLGALGYAEDLDTVARWCHGELLRWENYHRMFRAAKTVAERQRLGQYGLNSWNWYRHALVRFQSPAAEALLEEWLESLYMLGEGAQGLVELSVQEGLLEAEPAVRTRRDRAMSASLPMLLDPRVRRRANAIVAALVRSEPVPPDDYARQRSNSEAVLALALLGSDHAVDRILQLDTSQYGWTVVRAALVMMGKGVFVSGGAFAVAMQPFFERRVSSADVSSWEVVLDILAVLLGGEQPDVGIAWTRQARAARSQDHYLGDLCNLLRGCRHLVAAQYLVEISREDLSAAALVAVARSLSGSEHPTCHARLLELLEQGFSSFSADVSRVLKEGAVQLGRRNPSFRRGLVSSWHATRGPAVAAVLSEIGADDTLEVLLGDDDLLPLESILQTMVRTMTEARTPMGDGISHLLTPRAAPELKRRLAARLVPGTSGCVVAARLLAYVRLRRVESGHPPDEPIHPDVSLLPSLGKPWPLCC